MLDGKERRWAVLVSALPLFAAPLGFFACLLVVEPVWELWTRASVDLLPHLAVAGLLSGAAAVALHRAVGGAHLALALLPALGVGALVPGVVGFRLGLAEALRVLPTAAAWDRPVMLAAVAFEEARGLVLALFLAGALFALTGAALGLAAGLEQAPRRRLGLGLVGLAGLALGAWLLAVGRHETLLGTALEACRGSAPAERAADVTAALVTRAHAQPLHLWALGALAGVLGLAAVLLRATPRAAGGVVAFGLVSVVGASGLLALARVPEREVAQAAFQFEPLADLDGAWVDEQAVRLVLDGSLRTVSGLLPEGVRCLTDGPTAHRVERVAEHRRFADAERVERLKAFGSERMTLALGRGATGPGLEAFFTEALEAGVRQVDLVGLREERLPAGVEAPPLLRGVFTSYRAGRVFLAREDAQRPPPRWGRLGAQGLEVGAEVWPLDGPPPAELPAALKPDAAVAVRLERLEPVQLARAASAAASRGAALVVVAPAVEPSAILGLAEARGVLSPPSTPLVRGALDVAQLEKAVAQHRAALGACHPKEAGTVTLRFVVTAAGRVASASVRDSTLRDAAVEACVAAEVRSWPMPRPRGGGVALVTWPFALAPAPR